MGSDTTVYQIGHTVRSKCGRARVTYRPDWDAERPWIGYYNGTAEKHHATVRGGMFYYERFGFQFPRIFYEAPNR
jgi:hypothetical protein